MVANIRFALPDDLDFIFDCVHQLAIFEGVDGAINITKSTLNQWIFLNNFCHVIICEIKNKQVGMALFYYNYSIYSGNKGIYLENLYLKPDYRRLGIGTRIMDSLSNIAKKNSCKVITVSCLTNNKSANAFYKAYKMHFKEVVNNYEIKL